MREPWWQIVWKVTGETLLSMTYYTIFVIGIVYTSALTKLASHLTESKFVLYVMTLLEYSTLVTDALYFLTKQIRRASEEFRRSVQ